MWYYAWLFLRRQRGKSLLLASGFFLAACVLVLISATTNTLVIQGTQAISQNWRPTYDLVVLPPQSSLSNQELVPSDVLAGYKGGISLEQYAQIKTLAGVAVAAPIAYVGYFDLPTITIHTDVASIQPGFYREEWTQTSFNGQHHLVEQHFTFFLFIDGSDDCHFSTSDAAAVKRYNDHITAYAKQGIEYDCAQFDHNPSRVGLHVSPISEKYLLAAIDPSAENQLVNLNKSITQGRMLTEQDTTSFLGSTPSGSLYSFPILTHAQIPDYTTTRFNYVRLSTDNMTPEQVMKQGGDKYLKNLQVQQKFINQDIPAPENATDLFSSINLDWDGHVWSLNTSTRQAITAFFGKFYQSSSLLYRRATGPTGNTDPAYIVTPIGVQGPEVTFRNLNTPGTIKTGSGYFYQPVGEFSDTQLAAQFANPLNWLPESTYTVPPTVLRYDAQGKLVTPATLLPTVNTAGYVIQAPLALTTLKAAQQLLGDNFINAIRVKVSGVEQANEKSWQRIQQVATQIEQKTHLRVLITLGSSPRPVLVYVPGLKQGQLGATQDIAPIGWVEERWIAIGASLFYLQQTGQLQVLLLAALLTVCLGYLLVTLSSLVASQRRDLAVLSALGWRPWQPVRLFLTQTLTLACVGGLGGMGIALFVLFLVGASPPLLVVALTLPAILLLALVSSLYPLWQIGHIRPGEILRSGTTVASEKKAARGRLLVSLPALWAMALQNLTRRRGRTLIACLSLFLSAVLLVVMVDGILAFRQELQGTLLGTFVLLQTAIPQLAGALFAIVLTFLSVADLLLLQVRERRHELGLLQAIGWRPALVRRLLVQEGLTLALASALPGVVLASIILLVLHAARRSTALPFVAIGTVVLMVLVAALASLPALQAIKRLRLAEILRSE